MKTFTKITAICLLCIISLSLLVACSVSAEDALSAICKDNPTCRYVTGRESDISRAKSLIEAGLGRSLEGEISAYYIFSDLKTYEMCEIYEFEKSADADAVEEKANTLFSYAFVIRRGNIIITGNEKYANMIADKMK